MVVIKCLLENCVGPQFHALYIPLIYDPQFSTLALVHNYGCKYCASVLLYSALGSIFGPLVYDMALSSMV